MTIPGSPVFVQGEEVLLFLQRLSQEDKPPTGIKSGDYYVVYGSEQGKYGYGNGTIIDRKGNQFAVSEVEQKIVSIRGGE